jgi:hypothetical protein
MLANIGNVDVMPAMQDGYNFTLSDYLGSDICYQMQTDLQAGVCPKTTIFFHPCFCLRLASTSVNFAVPSTFEISKIRCMFVTTDLSIMLIGW